MEQRGAGSARGDGQIQPGGAGRERRRRQMEPRGAAVARKFSKAARVGRLAEPTAGKPAIRCSGDELEADAAESISCSTCARAAGPLTSGPAATTRAAESGCVSADGASESGPRAPTD